MGRAVPLGRRGVRRHEHGSHVIFYREQQATVLVIAVLHKRRLLSLAL